MSNHNTAIALDRAFRRYLEEVVTIKANASYPVYSNENCAERQLLRLEQIAEHGLPTAYEGMIDYLADFYMNFSWSDRSGEQMEMMLNHPRFDQIRAAFIDKYQFDWQKELTRGIDELVNDL